MRTVTEALLAETTGVLLLLEMYSFQMSLPSMFGSQDGAAQTTHPLATVNRCKAVLQCQRMVVNLQQVHSTVRVRNVAITARQKLRTVIKAQKQYRCFSLRHSRPASVSAWRFYSNHNAT